MSWTIEVIKPDGSLEPSASTRLLAAMIYPGGSGAERQRRSRLVAGTRNDDSLLKDLRRGFCDGAAAGEMTLTLLEQHQHHRRISLNQAVRLCRGARLHDAGLRLSGYSAHDIQEEDALTALRHRLGEGQRINRRQLLQAMRGFGRVAHLWGALILLGWFEKEVPIDDRYPLLMIVNAKALPRFAAIAEKIGQMAERVPVQGGGLRLLIEPANRLRLGVPQATVDDISVNFDPANLSKRMFVTAAPENRI